MLLFLPVFLLLLRPLLPLAFLPPQPPLQHNRVVSLSLYATPSTPTPSSPLLPRALYVHLPFCRRRCFYCDFPIKVVGDGATAGDEYSREYVQLVLREMKAAFGRTVGEGGREERGGDWVEGVPWSLSELGGLTTTSSSSSSSSPSTSTAGVIKASGGLTSIFFGGGTPSLTPPHLLRLLLKEIEDLFGVSEGAEVSMEMDPGTFDAERLEAFLACGG